MLTSLGAWSVYQRLRNAAENSVSRVLVSALTRSLRVICVWVGGLIVVDFQRVSGSTVGPGDVDVARIDRFDGPGIDIGVDHQGADSADPRGARGDRSRQPVRAQRAPVRVLGDADREAGAAEVDLLPAAPGAKRVGAG